MSERDLIVVFEAELNITLDEPYDSDVVKQAVQDAVGHTGVVVTEVLVADGASDL